MKKILLSMIAAVCLSASAFAQAHSERISLGVGLLYENGLDATLSWEHETNYHNAWEYFVNGYLKWDECASCGHICPDSFWKNYRTWGVGAAYKPCVVRGRNHYGNVRIGASVGSNTDKFLGGFHVGYEHNFALRKGWVLYVQAKCDLMVPDREDLFVKASSSVSKFQRSNTNQDEDITFYPCCISRSRHCSDNDLV